jgi:hypothetical protein
MKSLKFALVLVLVLAGRSIAQMAAMAVWFTSTPPYSNIRDTSTTYGFYASSFEGRTLLQARRGIEGQNVVGLFAGRNLISDSYHKNLFVFLSGGFVTGDIEKGPSLELLVAKMTINGKFGTELRSQYGWGAFGTQNFARNSFMGFLALSEDVHVGMSADALYRPQSVGSAFERANVGPVIRVAYKDIFIQGWHYWEVNHPKAQRFAISVGVSP